jgi:hypothetical protein
MKIVAKNNNAVTNAVDHTTASLHWGLVDLNWPERDSVISNAMISQL